MKNANLKRVITIAMLLSLTLTLFAGCGATPATDFTAAPPSVGSDNSTLNATVQLETKSTQENATASQESITKLADTSSEWDGTATYDWYDGKSSPFEITKASDLAGLANIVNGTADIDSDGTNELAYDFSGKTINLASDIALNDTSASDWATNSPKEWTPIGTSSSITFKGTFNGDNHTISGIYINATSNYQGLFGYVGENGTIQNLNVTESNIKSTGTNCFVGGVAGTNKGTIKNCTFSGEVSIAGENAYLGGIAGLNFGAIRNCYNTGNVALLDNSTNGSGGIGGIAGKNNSGTITNCQNTGNIAGTQQVGGIVGKNGGTNSGTVINCYNTGNVEGTQNVGGVVGKNYGETSSCTITNCYNTSNVEGTQNVGAVAGSNYNGTITTCYNTGNIEGTQNVGAVVGSNYNNGTITNCFAHDYVTVNDTAVIDNTLVGNDRNSYATTCSIARPITTGTEYIIIDALNGGAEQTSNTISTAGSYYLAEDVAVSLTIDAGTAATPVNLNLNGYTITATANSSAMKIKTNATLNLFDSQGYGVRTSGGEYNTAPTTNEYTNKATDENENAIGGLITGGNAAYGGGVYINSNAEFNMFAGTIADNKASSNGGGVCVDENAEFNMFAGTIAGNSAGFGGGVCNGCNFSGISTFEMSGGEISANKASSGGGVLNNNGKTFTMSGGTISANSATNTFGGGISNNGTFKMTGGEISANSAATNGGGINNNGTFEMTGGEISANNAAINGGGIKNSGTFNLSGKSEIFDNTKGSSGETAEDIFIYYSSYDEAGYPLTITAALQSENQIVVNYNDGNDGTFAKGAVDDTSTGVVDEAYQITTADKDIFKQNDATKAIALVGNELKIITLTKVATFKDDFGGVVTIYNTGSAEYAYDGTTYGSAEDLNSYTPGDGDPLIAHISSLLNPWTPLYQSGTAGVLSTSDSGDAIASNKFQATANYYLAEDVTISTSIEFNTSAVYNLSLNGYVINANGTTGKVVDIGSGATLNLYDTSAPSDNGYTYYDGTKFVYDSTMTTAPTDESYSQITAIKGGLLTGASDGGVWNGGTFNMYAGTIAGNEANYGGGVYVNSGEFTMNGGTISSNATLYFGGGVYNREEFTMNGGTISSNSASSGGGVFSGDSFTMTGGEISDNNANGDGGGVYVEELFVMTGGEISSNSSVDDGAGVYNDGTFTMNDGKISGNESIVYGDGGGVNNDATFNMNGGEIVGNKAINSGGGVYNYGTFTMKAGEISANVAYDGAGVFDNATMNLSGTPVISGNEKGGTISYEVATGYSVSGGTASNLTIGVNGSMAISDGNATPNEATDALSAGANIGVMKLLPALSSEVYDTETAFASPASEADKEYFTADAEGYEVVFADNSLKIAKMSSGSPDLINLDLAAPTITLDGDAATVFDENLKKVSVNGDEIEVADKTVTIDLAKLGKGEYEIVASDKYGRVATKSAKVSSVEEPIVTPEPEKPVNPEVTPTPEPTQKPTVPGVTSAPDETEKGNAGAAIPIALAVLVVGGGAGYYFVKVKGKK